MTDRPHDPAADDRLSALLDGELDAGETARLRRDLDADPALAEVLADLERVRTMLRAAAPVEPRSGVLPRIVAALTADSVTADEPTDDRSPATVTELPRRRVPRFAAAAAAVAIIASVVGGVGGSTTLPAFGELIARHDAAAVAEVPAGADPMPMDDMNGVGPTMPEELSMTSAFRTDELVHLVYRDPAGATVSVFRQEGDTDVDCLPYGKVSEMAGNAVWSSTMGDRHVAVVDGDGYVWTVVGADDHDTMMVAMTDDLPRRDPGILERLGDVADAVVRPWRLD